MNIKVWRWLCDSETNQRTLRLQTGKVVTAIGQEEKEREELVVSSLKEKDVKIEEIRDTNKKLEIRNKELEEDNKNLAFELKNALKKLEKIQSREKSKTNDEDLNNENDSVNNEDSLRYFHSSP